MQSTYSEILELKLNPTYAQNNTLSKNTRYREGSETKTVQN